MPFTVLVTGATSGIGRATALHLAARGHHVFATGRREAELTSLARDAAGTKLETFVLDVTDPEGVQRAVAHVADRTDGHGLDVLVNNAGYGHFGPVELVDDAAVKRQFDTNVFGLLSVTRAFLPSMRARGRGRIVNVSSVGGRMTFPLAGVYNATKYALESLSDALRVEVAPFGVHVVLVEPGVIRTEFAARTVSLAEQHLQSGSPYAALKSSVPALEQRFDRYAVGPEVVAAAIARAVETRKPKARYVAPRRSVALLWLVHVLPTRWVDCIFARLFGLTRERLALEGR